MMNSMHTGRYNDQVQDSFDLNRQPPVRMVEKSGSLECNEKDHQHYWSNTKNHYCQRKKADRKDHLTKMESRRSANVEIEIGVMHVMKSPEERNHMVRPMPPPI